MSVLPQIGVCATSVLSFVADMSPCKVASKELLGASANEPLEVTKSNIPIYADIQRFIDKTTG